MIQTAGPRACVSGHEERAGLDRREDPGIGGAVASARQRRDRGEGLAPGRYTPCPRSRPSAIPANNQATKHDDTNLERCQRQALRARLRPPAESAAERRVPPVVGPDVRARSARAARARAADALGGTATSGRNAGSSWPRRSSTSFRPGVALNAGYFRTRGAGTSSSPTAGDHGGDDYDPFCVTVPGRPASARVAAATGSAGSTTSSPPPSAA